MNRCKAFKKIEKRLGLPALKAKQVESVKSLLNRKDTFVIAGPGFGKSAIYQTAALMDETRLTLVIEPTLSLIQDQVNRLRSLPDPVLAEYMTSTNIDDHNQIINKIKDKALTVLFVTPERLQKSAFQKAIKHNEPALIVVDECHLVLDWGETFRQDYLRIGAFVDSLHERPTILTMTATAPMEDRSQIIFSLFVIFSCQQAM